MEILLVLPIFWLVIVGVISTFHYVAEAYAVGQAAESGVVTMAGGGSHFSVQQAVDLCLIRDGYGLTGVEIKTDTANKLASVEVVLPLNASFPMMPRLVAEIRSSQIVGTKGGGGNPGPWW